MEVVSKNAFLHLKRWYPKGKSSSTHHFQGLFMYICIFPAPLSESQRYTWWCTPSTSASSEQGQFGFQRKKNTNMGEPEKKILDILDLLWTCLERIPKILSQIFPNGGLMVIHHGTIRKKNTLNKSKFSKEWGNEMLYCYIHAWLIKKKLPSFPTRATIWRDCFHVSFKHIFQLSLLTPSLQ